MRTREMTTDGARRSQGRQRQEGQAQGFHEEEVIFRELAFGREGLFMGDIADDMAGDGVQYANTDEAMDACTVCTKPRRVHDGVGIRHTYTPPGTRVDTSQFDRERRSGAHRSTPPGNTPGAVTGVLSVPFDPVLRLALIDAGVITPDDLAAAERKLGAFNAALKPPPQGEG